MLVAFALIFYFLLYLPQKNWNKTHPDTLEKYLQKFPKAKTQTGIACGTCGSKSLRNLGVQNATDRRRLVSCNSCSANLYHAKN